MRVFDESWVAEVRSRYGTKSTYVRPFVAFLALEHSAAEERAKIEEWFKTLPDDIKPDFLGRLRGISKGQHLSAYYELVVRHLFQDMGYSVKMNPWLEEGEPDLLIEGKGLETPIVVEVATVFDEPRLIKEKEKQNKILAELEKIQHYFFVTVSFRSDKIPEKVNYDKVRGFVERWLDSFDSRNIESGNAISYREDGLWLDLILMPKTISEKSSIIGAVIYPVRWISDTQLKRAIEKKIQKYKSVKKLNSPYIVAACLDVSVPAGEEQAINALFGRLSVTVDIAKGGIVDEGRDFSGLVTPKPGLGGLARNRRLSALLVIRSRWLQPSDNGIGHRVHSAFILHNPNAKIPLGQEFLKGYPQFIKSHEDDKYVHLEWIDKDSKSLLDC